ncbi:polysaccharide deacetylase family protein [Azospirillum sp. ST 5-10]|uniref:polysaccharide deacetylase family protein n=1 Tax=unclassified Azospirillum TaxID=2630922 RepID=UPI003F4A3495
MARATLTFDNGPIPGATGRILDVLRDRGLRATFFLVGERLADPAARRLAERARAEGHWIGNHTLSHGDPLGERRDPGHAAREIGETERILGDLAMPERLFRPVGRGCLGPHVLSREARDHLLAHRHTLVTWTTVPRDWEEPPREWVDRAFAALPGEEHALVVLHDHCLDAMMDTLDTFLDRLAAAGVAVVQDLPDRCVPIVRGRVVRPIDGLVAG